MAEVRHAGGRLVERCDLEIANRLDELARVSVLIDDLAARHHLGDDLLADLQVSVDEVLSNIVRYAWDDAYEHRIGVRIDVHERAIRIETQDDGRAFDPVAAHAARLRDPSPVRTPGGRGLRLVFALMSEVRYARHGSRNRLDIVRLLGHAEAPAAAGVSRD